MNLVLAVCDDDKDTVKKVSAFCESLIKNEWKHHVELILFYDGKSLLEYEKKIDILILDIEMDGINGIDVKNQLLFEGAKTKIIFLTTHLEMMEEAFGKYVYGFVNKYNSEDKLGRYLIQILKDIKEEYDYIIVDDHSAKVKIMFNDIYYIKASGVYIEIHTLQKVYLVRQKLKEYANIYKEKGFYQIHKSYIVNVRYIQLISQKGIDLVNKVHLPISRGTCKQIKQYYMDFLQERI